MFENIKQKLKNGFSRIKDWFKRVFSRKETKEEKVTETKTTSLAEKQPALPKVSPSKNWEKEIEAFYPNKKGQEKLSFEFDQAMKEIFLNTSSLHTIYKPFDRRSPNIKLLEEDQTTFESIMKDCNEQFLKIGNIFSTSIKDAITKQGNNATVKVPTKEIQEIVDFGTSAYLEDFVSYCGLLPKNVGGNKLVKDYQDGKTFITSIDKMDKIASTKKRQSAFLSYYCPFANLSNACFTISNDGNFFECQSVKLRQENKKEKEEEMSL